MFHSLRVLGKCLILKDLKDKTLESLQDPSAYGWKDTHFTTDQCSLILSVSLFVALVAADVIKSFSLNCEATVLMSGCTKVN